LINLKKISTHSNEGLLKARGLREALFVLLNGLALLILLALLTSVPADPSVFVSDGTSDVKNFMGVFGAGFVSAPNFFWISILFTGPALVFYSIYTLS
jgi:hypothetical protein